jgi:tellurite methyltransferase
MRHVLWRISGVNMIDSPWSSYYKNTLLKEPNKTAIIACKQFINTVEKTVLDIGSGTGCDSMYFLENGFTVFALDQETNALDILQEKIKGNTNFNINFIHSQIQEYIIPNNTFDIINASYSLPFMPKKQLMIVWQKIYDGLKINGILSCQLFGIHDDWAKNTEMAFLSIGVVKRICKNYEIVHFEELDADGLIADKSAKHWHLFDLVLKKNSFN